MPIFRDDNVLVISIGSNRTLAQYGFGESLTPASIEIPTVVYKDANREGIFRSKPKNPETAESTAVYPVKAGKITNIAALKYLIKLIYRSATALYPTRPASFTALLLVVGSRWSRLQIEEITHYVFENIKLPAFSILHSALVASFAFALQDALVIDIGEDKTEITPILEFSVVEPAKVVVDVGGNSINEALQKRLPELSVQQIEDLKRSSIFSVLSEDAAKSSWFGLNPVDDLNPEADGVVDIAAIVTSGRTREILAQRERDKLSNDKKRSEPANVDREYNTFVDSNKNVVTVGKERFQGSEELRDRICEAVGEAIKKIDEVNRRQDCWDNIIIVGRGSSPRGLKEAILDDLQSRYVVSRQVTYSELPSTFNTSGQNTPVNGLPSTPLYPVSHHQSSQINHGHGQVPTSIRAPKMPEYFPEWKHRGWEDVGFLGAQIAARQMFTSTADSSYVSRRDYNEVGPTAIWDI